MFAIFKKRAVELSAELKALEKQAERLVERAGFAVPGVVKAGLSPKVPYIGYKGQFDTDQEAWKDLNRIPRSYVQVDPLTNATGQQTLPLPQRQAFTPNFQEYEVAKDSCRRAIRAAMGISPLPTAEVPRCHKDQEKRNIQAAFACTCRK